MTAHQAHVLRSARLAVVALALGFPRQVAAQANDWVQSLGCVDVRSGSLFSIHCARFDAEGNGLADTTLSHRLCVGAMRGVHAVPASDGAGGAFVVWIEAAREDCNLWIHHVRADGSPAPGWSVEGRALCVAPGTQTQPALLPLASGSVVAAWKDFRDPHAVAVRMARLSDESLAAAPEEPASLVVSDRAATDPNLCSDGAGGAWMVWLDEAGGARTLRLAHLEANGTSDADRIAAASNIDTGTGSVEDVSITPDAAGGLYVAWRRREATSSALRLQRIGVSGVACPGWVPGGLDVVSDGRPLSLGSLTADSAGVALTYTATTEDSVEARWVLLGPDGAPRPGWDGPGHRLGLPGSDVAEPVVSFNGSGARYLSWTQYSAAQPSGEMRLLGVAADGSPAEGWPADGRVVTSASTEKYNVKLLPFTDGTMVTWSEAGDQGRGTVMASAIFADELPELLTVESWPDVVRLAWRIPHDAGYSIRPEKLALSGEWVAAGSLTESQDERVALEDIAVRPGTFVRYRLCLVTPALTALMTEIEVAVPAAMPFDLRGIRAEGNGLRIFYSLPVRADVRLDLFDVQGRRIMQRTIKPDHAGALEARLPLPDVAKAGVYFARLQHAGASKVRRFVFTR